METQILNVSSKYLKQSTSLVKKEEGKALPVSTLKSEPSVFDYRDYRSYLNDWFSWKKKENQNYSGAIFAKRAGLKAHPLLGMVIRGERNLSYETIRSFSKALGLEPKEKIYFEKLVLFNQAKSQEDKNDYFNELHSVSRGDGKKLLTKFKDYATFLSHWYVVAIRELVVLPNFKSDPSWIAQKLKNKITKKEAKVALELLLRLGLIQKNKEGKCEIVHTAMDFDFGMVDFAIQNYHGEFLGRAKEALEKESLDEREFSSLTVSLSDGELNDLRSKVKEFRKKVNADYTDTEKQKKTSVVAVNMQVLVLTKKEKPTEEVK